MIIDSFDTSKKVLIVAEIGNNHEGSPELAQKLVRLAAKAGADAVKFQTIVPERLVSVLEKERIEQLKKFQLGYSQFKRLAMTAKEEGVLFLSTPFDLESARFLNCLVPAFKIASGDNNFFPLLECVADMGKPVLLSTGLAGFEEIQRSVHFIQKRWADRGITQDLAVLHCVSSYPTEAESVNLAAIWHLRELGVTVGYSDHALGIEAAVLSVTLGARIIEKHFTIDKKYSRFRDHALSADPKDLAELVEKVRQAEIFLGRGVKFVQESERENLQKMRRSIAAGRDLEKGKRIEFSDIAWVRPGGGLAPGCEAEILGKRLKRPVRAGEMILAGDVD